LTINIRYICYAPEFLRSRTKWKKYVTTVLVGILIYRSIFLGLAELKLSEFRDRVPLKKLPEIHQDGFDGDLLLKQKRQVLIRLKVLGPEPALASKKRATSMTQKSSSSGVNKKGTTRWNPWKPGNGGFLLTSYIII